MIKTINHETTLFLHVDGLVQERCNSIANALELSFLHEPIDV